jgi:hypothetical protein
MIQSAVYPNGAVRFAHGKFVRARERESGILKDDVKTNSF